MKEVARKGFTMIELMLATLFLATLMVTIAVLVNMITGIYQKGLSMRAVNAMGRQLVDEISRVVAGSPIPDGGKSINPVPGPTGNIGVNEVNAALRKYFVTDAGETVVGEGRDGLGGFRYNYGAFCTAAYSYVWNTQLSYADWRENPHTANVLLMEKNTETGKEMLNDGKPYKMARVADPSRYICEQMANGVTGRTLTIPIADKEPIEMINTDEVDLILYDFNVFPATQNTMTGQVFYSATFILGTMRGGVNITATGDYCNEDNNPLKVASGLSTLFNYCAVNKFNFAMRATGFSDREDQYGERGGK